jgi:integrase/recombinase XerD
MAESTRILSKELVVSRHVEDIAIIGSWLFQKGVKTQRYYRRIVREFFQYFPHITLKTTEITHLALFLKTYGITQNSTRNTYKNALSSLFTFATKTGYIQRNPALALETIKTPDKIYSKVLSKSQVEQMLLKEKNLRNQMIIKILYFTGVRVDEICKLKKQSFHRTENGVVMMVEGKGRKVRSIHLPSHLVQDIENYILTLPSEFLFTTQNNCFEAYRPLSTSQVFRIIKNSAKTAKLSVEPSPHWLRHTSATHAIEAGAPIHVVQRSLGHESISTTGKYLDLRPKESVGDYLKPLDEAKSK